MREATDKIIIYNGGFMLGYWHFEKRRGRKPEKIGMPIPFAPTANNQNDYFYEIEKNKVKDYIRVIDPKDFSLTEIKKICEYNNIPFFWVTPFFQQNRQKISFTPNNPLSKAIDSFTMLFAGSTVSQYESVFLNMIKNQRINQEMSIRNYQEIQNDILNKIINDFSEKDSSKWKCYYIFVSFNKFLKEHSFFKKQQAGNKHRTKRKNSISESEVKTFLSALKKIDPVHELIAKILWLINRTIGKGKIFTTIQSVLRMRIEDFVPQTKMITIYHHKIAKSCILGIGVSDDIYSRLLELMDAGEIFIFRTKYGAPIDARQLRKSFFEACKTSKLNKSISPSNLF